MCLIPNNLLPFFGIIVAACHHNRNLLCPSGAKLQYFTIDLHCDRAGVGNNHCLARQQIFPIVLVMLHNIFAKRIDRFRCPKNAFHLPQHFFALFNCDGIRLLFQEIIGGIDQF